MSATSLPAPAGSSADDTGSISVAEIDASCRWPVLFLFGKSAGWLLLAALLAFLNSLKLHAPGLLAGCPWLTYGKLAPAQTSALLYGFGVQAALASALWLMAHLGRTRLAVPGLVFAGGMLWNLAVFIGVIGILAGDGTGHRWLEIPHYASPLMFLAYCFVGAGGLVTLANRRAPGLAIPQWFLFTALLWFPWVYSAANYLLIFAPVRGVVQAVIDGWYVANLSNIWFGFMGLGVILHLIPALTGKEPTNRNLVMFAFWMLVLFSGWGNVPAGSPIPSWIPSLATVMTVFTLAPLIALAIAFRKALAGCASQFREKLPLRLSVLSGVAFLAAGFLGIVATLPGFEARVHLTTFAMGRSLLYLYGFVGLAVFAAMYHIVPRLIGSEFSSTLLVKLHVRCTVAGLSIGAFSLMIGGWSQGVSLANPELPFLDALKSGMMWIRLSTLGDLLVLVGSAGLWLNGLRLAVQCWRACCLPALLAAAKSEPEPVAAEVAQ